MRRPSGSSQKSSGHRTSRRDGGDAMHTSRNCWRSGRRTRRAPTLWTLFIQATPSELSPGSVTRDTRTHS
jgi:hypothetical protein